MRNIYPTLIIVFACILSCITNVTAIAHCANPVEGWYNIEEACGNCIDPPCNYGFEIATWNKCFLVCHQRGCKRTVCNSCNDGYYRDGFVDVPYWFYGNTKYRYATSCSPCPAVVGCSGVTRCTTSSDSTCPGSCIRGFYKDSASRCQICTKITNCMPNETTCTRSTDQKCGRCLPGYYLEPGNQKCTACPSGSYCDGIARRPCWDVAANRYYYCPNARTTPEQVRTECPTQSLFGRNCDQSVKCVVNVRQGTCGKDVCWSLRGNGKCNECSHNSAGEGCEHKVCLYSKLGQELNKKYTRLPAEYDFSTYVAENIHVSQVLKQGNQFGLEVSYIPVALDIAQYRLHVNGQSQSIVNTFAPNCTKQQHIPSQRTTMPLYQLNSNTNVGSKYDLCIVGEWKDSTSYLTSGSWINLSEGQERDSPWSCLSHTVQFQSSVIFIVRDLFNSVGVENAVVHFVVQHKDVRHRYSVTTNDGGRATANVIVPDVDLGIDVLNLQIENITTFGQDDSTRNFTLCSTPPPLNTACPENQMTLLNNTSHLISHLNRRGIPEFFIVDKTVVKVEGQLLHPGPNPASTDILSCGIFNATVNAIDGKSGELIQQTHTNGTGYFSLAVVRRTNLKLHFDYHNHTFIGQENGNGFIELLLSQNGYTVTDPITGLVFKDITMSNITITGAVTECMFDIGNYELEISVPSCPSIGTYSVLSNGATSFSLQVPAHVYEWELKGFDGFGYQLSGGMNGYVDGDTIADRFNYMFPKPTRTWNLTDSEEHTTFIFHPSVEVSMAIAKGGYIPEVFPSSCHSKYEGSIIPFDFTLRGSSVIDLNFYISQVYVDNENRTYICEKLPDGFVLMLESDLGVSLDPCSANLGGCNATFQYVERYGYNQTIAQARIVSGSVTTYSNPYEETNPLNQLGKTIEDYVGSNAIRYSVLNERYFPAEINHEAGRGSAQVLLLGEKVLTENTMIAVIGDQELKYPLLYLYAPPAGPAGNFRHVQTVTISFEESIVNSLEVTNDFKFGGNFLGGVKFTTKGTVLLPFVGEHSLESNLEFLIGGGRTNLARYNWDNEVTMNITSQTLTLSTPVGLSGKDGDMVLLLGTVMTLESTVSTYLNETSCNIVESLGVVWGQGQESLMFLSRSDSEREMQKIRFSKSANLVKLNDEMKTIEERENARILVDKADNEIYQWSFLLDHWDQDREQAKKNKYDLRKKYPHLINNTEATHTMYLGASTVTIEKTSTNTNSTLQDYEHKVFNKGFKQKMKGHVMMGMEINAGFAKLDTSVGSVFEQDFESTWLDLRTIKNTKTEKQSKKVSVSLVESDAGDTTCIEIYESPWSGTFVFEICGGATMCPHVEGTDARQKFKLYTKETPNTLSQSDKGKIVMEIDTLDVIDPDVTKIDLVVELASATASSPVAFNVGSASLNQPLEFSVAARQKQLLTIFYERLDSSLKRLDVVGVIKSKCDSNIRENFKYELVWESQCPPILWGGSLKEAGSYITLTQKDPMISISAVNPTGKRWRDYDNFKVDVSLYYREHNVPTAGWKIVPERNLLSSRVNGESTTFLDKEDSSGRSSIWISAKDNNLFVDGVMYEFYLATSCYERLEDGTALLAGEMQSGIRLGVVDMSPPEIMSVTFMNEVEKPTRNLQICSILFNEPIDCSNPLLQVDVILRISFLLGKPNFFKKTAKTYCTSQLQQLHVLLPLESLEEIDTWSQKNVSITMKGIYDIFGNRFGNIVFTEESAKEIRKRRTVNDVSGGNETLVTINMFIPEIPQYDESEAESNLPNETIMKTVQKDILTSMFPLDVIPTISRFGNPSKKSKTKTVVISVTSILSGISIIALGSYFILKHRKGENQKQEVSQIMKTDDAKNINDEDDYNIPSSDENDVTAKNDKDEMTYLNISKNGNIVQ